MEKSCVTQHADIIKELKNAIFEAKFDMTRRITEEALKKGILPKLLMEKSIYEGIRDLEKELFKGYKVWGHPTFFLSIEAARRSLEIIEPYLDPQDEEVLGTVVLGVPAGDTHDMGAKMLALTLMSANFQVVYLGMDVPSSLFVNKAMENEAQILAISSYQPTGFARIMEILDLLAARGLRDKVKVMVGGCSITKKFADKYGLGYAEQASAAVMLAKEYVGR